MYNLNTGIKQSTREGFGKAIVELGGKNKDIVVLAASVGDSTQAYKFREKFPNRYIEAGIAEQNMIGMACGLALAGKIPFPTSFATFMPGRCYDHIRQSVCYSDLNVKMVATHAGITVGADGATHQMMEDIAMLRALPNLKLIVPADALEAEKATIAMAKIKGPCYLRLGREKMPIVTTEKTPFEIGKAITLKNGKDITIIACGAMVCEALVAAEKLKEEKIDARVINLHTIKPIDEKTIIKAAKETGGIVTAEENQVMAGMGSAVAEVIVKNKPIPIRFIGMQDKFGQSGKPDELMEAYGMKNKDIIKAVHDTLK